MLQKETIHVEISVSISDMYAAILRQAGVTTYWKNKPLLLYALDLHRKNKEQQLHI